MAFSVSDNIGYSITLRLGFVCTNSLKGLLLATLTFTAAVIADLANSKFLFNIKNILLFIAAPV